MNKNLYELSFTLKREMHRKVLSVVLISASVFVFINLILTFLVFPVREKSVSMEYDIKKDSCIMFSPVYHNFERGSVVLIKPEENDEASMLMKIADVFVKFFTARQVSILKNSSLMGDQSKIRRIVGVPGDTIYMRDYVLYIKPKFQKYFLTEFELINKSYNINIVPPPAFWDSDLGVTGSFDEMILGKDEYFVLGDLRASSIDSRLWGPVTASDIEASAVFQYFPLDSIRIF